MSAPMTDPRAVLRAMVTAIEDDDRAALAELMPAAHAALTEPAGDYSIEDHAAAQAAAVELREQVARLTAELRRVEEAVCEYAESHESGDDVPGVVEAMAADVRWLRYTVLPERADERDAARAELADMQHRLDGCVQAVLLERRALATETLRVSRMLAACEPAAVPRIVVGEALLGYHGAQEQIARIGRAAVAPDDVETQLPDDLRAAVTRVLADMRRDAPRGPGLGPYIVALSRALDPEVPESGDRP